jgi:hypothetical protein
MLFFDFVKIEREIDDKEARIEMYSIYLLIIATAYPL